MTFTIKQFDKVSHNLQRAEQCMPGASMVHGELCDLIVHFMMVFVEKALG